MGELRGKQMQPRDIAKLCWNAGWQDLDGLVCAVAVCLAESQGYTEAHNANSNGSEDFGLFQINLAKEWATVPAAYKKLYGPEYNVERAYGLYMARGFQPWAAFNSGVWLHDSYLGRAVLGVANYAGEKFLAYPVPDKPDGDPYKHVFTTPMCDFHFRVQSLVGLAATIRNRLRARPRKTSDRDNLVLIGAVLTYVKRTRP